MKRASRHKKLSARMRQRRHARRHSGLVTGDTSVWSAAAWWRDSDPSMQVIGLNPKVVEKKIFELMKEEAERAAEDDYDGDTTVESAMDKIAWSGMHPFTLKDVVSGRELDEAIDAIKDDGYYYPETP